MAWVCAAAEAVLEGPAHSLGGQLDVQRGEGRLVLITGSLQAAASAICDRCGDPTERAVDTEVALKYLPHSDEIDPEFELGVDDLDLGWYRNGQLDLSDALREALALALPTRTLCLDSAGCEARTQALLERDNGKATGHPAFAALLEQ
jgi:uncharacterized metal-binding protein YceD (DUF177 family)